jgi:hypothetical protein
MQQRPAFAVAEPKQALLLATVQYRCSSSRGRGSYSDFESDDNKKTGVAVGSWMMTMPMIEGGRSPQCRGHKSPSPAKDQEGETSKSTTSS